MECVKEMLVKKPNRVGCKITDKYKQNQNTSTICWCFDLGTFILQN
jgi:hypothetical protein